MHLADHLEILYWLLAIALGYYIGLPLLISRHRYAAHPRLVELDLESLDPPVAKFLMRQTRILFKLGFGEPTLVEIPSATPNVTAYLIMLVNREAGDKAMVTALIAENMPHLSTHYVEFSTRFETGEAFNTHNTRTLPAFPPAPRTVRTQVPPVTDPRELYQLHTFVMNKHGVYGKKELYEPGEAYDYLVERVFAQSYEEQAKRGWLYLDQNSDSYRPTLVGAFLMAWGLLQPFKTLRTMALQRRARAILREFDQSRRARDPGAYEAVED